MKRPIYPEVSLEWERNHGQRGDVTDTDKSSSREVVSSLLDKDFHHSTLIPVKKTYALQMGDDRHHGALKTGNWSYVVVKVVSRDEQIVKSSRRLRDLLVVYDEAWTQIVVNQWGPVPRPFSKCFAA